MPDVVIGKTISHYRIVEKLGEGGSGVVYKAEDEALKRVVALKFLRTELFENEEFKARLLLEAQAAAALDHPNICTVHEIGQDEGRPFIVMAFVEGRTVRAAAQERPFELRHGVKVAIEIARGLEEAHGKGVVHRDIKSANVMLTPRDGVKILDFGLAYLRGGSRITTSGTRMGTPAYMSPEQALGEDVDHRTDIWALGVVVYEMVAGKLPFAAEHEQAAIYSILNREPDPLSAQRADVPVELDRIVSRALAKNKEERYQHVEDIIVDLRKLQFALDGEASPGEAAGAEQVPSWSQMGSSFPRKAQVGVVLALAIVGLGVWTIWDSPNPLAEQPPRYELLQLTRDSALATSPSLSPDGRLLLFASDRGGQTNLDIWMQQVPGGEPVRRTSHPADDHQASFLPDGSAIIFRSERGSGGIYFAPTLGGEERLLVEDARHPSVSPDGTRVAYSVGDFLRSSRVFVIPAAGGDPTPVETNLPWTWAPTWTPDGRHLLFLGSTEPTVYRLTGKLTTVDWWVAPVEGGQAIKVGLSEVLNRMNIELPEQMYYRVPTWDATGEYIIFAARSGDSTNPWRIRISPETWKVVGDAQPLTTATNFSEPSFSSNGQIVVSSKDTSLNIWRLPIDADRGQVTGPPVQVTRESGRNFHPTISSDAKTLLFISSRSGSNDVWMKDLDSGRESSIVANPGNDYRALISADSETVTYGRREGARVDIFVSPLRRAGERKLIEISGGLATWSSDGKKILYWSDKPIRFHSIDLETGQSSDFIGHPDYDIHTVRFSPDDRHVSFKLVMGPGRESIHIAPVHDGIAADQQEWIQVTDEHLDARSWWSPDGNLLYVLSWRDGSLCIWARALDPASKTPDGPLREIHHFHGRHRIANANDVGYAMTGDSLYLGLGETTADIWMARPREQLAQP